MKYLFLLITISISPFLLNGQEVSKKKFSWPSMNLRYGIANHFHLNFPSNNIGLEVFPISEASILIERGWVYEANNFDGDLVKARKFNLELRFYPKEYKDKVFIGARFHHRSSTVFSRYTLGFDCPPQSYRNYECVYYKDFTGNIGTDFYAYQLIFGAQVQIYEIFFVEIYTGLGQSIHELDRSSIEGGNFVENRRLYSESSFDSKFYPSIKANLVFYLK